MPNERSGGTAVRWRVTRRLALLLVPVAGVGVAVWALQRLGFGRIGHALLSLNVAWALLGLLLMCTSLVFRAESWYALLRAAGTAARRLDAARGVMIGVLMSAALPGRLGEPARVFIVSRRLGNTRRWLATVAGTVFAQTLINIVALGLLAVGALAGPGLFRRHVVGIVVALGVPVAIGGAIVIAPGLLHRLRFSRIALVRRVGAFAAAQTANLRRGLVVLRRPGAGAHAIVAQLVAWVLQWMACYMLIRAYGLDNGSGLAAAAGVLFAVNVTAAVPVTPSNVGIFQAACIVVLAAYGIGKTRALAYGIALQALEVTTALLLGVPALVLEGVSWNMLRERADEIVHEEASG